MTTSKGGMKPTEIDVERIKMVAEALDTADWAKVDELCNSYEACLSKCQDQDEELTVLRNNYERCKRMYAALEKEIEEAPEVYFHSNPEHKHDTHKARLVRIEKIERDK
jgi:hypothetical protein